jgi:hypothetical protein
MMKVRYLLVAAAVTALVGVQQLAAHRQHAAQLTVAVVTADQTGLDSAPPQAALAAYTKQHMGTQRRVFLSGRFEGATAAAQQAANPQSNGQVYAQAQAACGGKLDSVTQARCVTNYVSSHSQPSANPQPVQLPERSDAQFNPVFTSPRWTPDSTGLALVLTLAFVLVAGVMGLRRR